VADYNFINRRLATGAALSSEDDVAQMVADGITDVIDCRAEFNDAPLFVSQPEIRYLWCPTEDDGKPKSARWFSKGVVFALDGLSHHARKVITHCAAGVNRGPSMAYAIMLAQGYPADMAEAMIRAARPQVGLAYKLDAEAAVTKLHYV
jgi:protein-tyrosine phosphatase